MSLLKGIASLLSNPLALSLVLMIVGFMLLPGVRRRMGAWTIAAGAGLAYLASTALIGNALLGPLEHEYPPFDPGEAPAVRDIVVLGSGYEPSDHVPVTGALDPDGLVRIVEGVRLARSIPGARLVVSGGAAAGLAPAAVGYARLAQELGIQPSSLVVLGRAVDTEQEARDVSATLGQTRFILVTSAYHMPRAMRLMRRAGADPIAAPTGQTVHTASSRDRIGLIPGSRGLHKTEAALHEYLGLAAIAILDNVP